MKESVLLRKTCSIYANDLHFATVIFPYVCKEIEAKNIVLTIFQKDEEENIEKIIKNIGLNSEVKEEIKKIDWKGTDIKKIRENFKIIETDIKDKRNISIIVQGKNNFIQKVNKAIDLWVKNKMEDLEENRKQINVINCFALDENKNLNKILNTHEYMLKTVGIEEIDKKEKLLKAN